MPSRSASIEEQKKLQLAVCGRRSCEASASCNFFCSSMLADLDGADRLGHDGPCNRCCVAQANQILEWRLFDISMKHFSRADLTCAIRLLSSIHVRSKRRPDPGRRAPPWIVRLRGGRECSAGVPDVRSTAEMSPRELPERSGID